MIEALTEHYLLASDWETLKTTLLDHPDPAVRVGTAIRLLWPVLRALESEDLDLGGVETALVTDERKQGLIAVLAEGLSHDDGIASGAGDQPPVPT